MDRRSVLGLLAAFAAHPNAARTQTVQSQSSAGKEYLKKQLVTSEKPEEASMDEISARLGWVLAGQILPDQVRERTLARANNEKPDFVGIWPKREDVSITKRSLCFLILILDDNLKAQE